MALFLKFLLNFMKKVPKTGKDEQTVKNLQGICNFIQSQVSRTNQNKLHPFIREH